MKNEQYNLLNQKIDALLGCLNGGKGSGNFGHSGRVGKRGGSGKGQASSSETGIFDNPLESGDNY